MTLNNKYINTLLIASSITLLFSACSIIQKTAEQPASESESVPQKPTTNTVDYNNSEVVATEVATSTVTKTQSIEPVEQATKTVSNKANTATLTEDQKAMTADELLNDTDLIRPIIKDDNSNYSDSAESDDDYDDEYFAPEVINFDDDYTIPEFAQKLLDESHPQYYPPTGKLFGFMRRHLLMRGDSPKPWTVIDDFNGDNKPDWAALMVNKDQQLDVIVIYSEDDKYRLEVLFESAGIDNNSIKIALSQEKPGDKIGASFKDKPGKYRTATLEFPGINIMYYTKSSSLFYWHKYYFDELLTSN